MSDKCKFSFMDAEHEKVYEQGVLYPTYPPKKKWICRNCGEVGYETVGEIEPINDFDKLMKKFHKK